MLTYQGFTRWEICGIYFVIAHVFSICRIDLSVSSEIRIADCLADAAACLYKSTRAGASCLSATVAAVWTCKGGNSSNSMEQNQSWKANSYNSLTKKFVFPQTWRFRRTRHWIPSLIIWIQSTPSRQVCLNSIIVLSSPLRLGCPTASCFHISD